MEETYNKKEKIRDFLIILLMPCLIILSACITKASPIIGSFIVALFIMMFVSRILEIILKLHKNTNKNERDI